jgi:hypothetical protein
VDVETIQVGIAPPHGNLNRVMEVGNAVVASQKQSPPNHRADAAQDNPCGGTQSNLEFFIHDFSSLCSK